MSVQQYTPQKDEDIELKVLECPAYWENLQRTLTWIEVQFMVWYNNIGSSFSVNNN